MSALKKLSLSRRQLFLYALFGVLTTVVNIAVYSLCTRMLDISMPISNAFAWFFVFSRGFRACAIRGASLAERLPYPLFGRPRPLTGESRQQAEATTSWATQPLV